MRSLLIMAAGAAAAILLSGCRDKKPEPVPGPQSALTERTTPGGQANTYTLDEAFSARSSKESRSLFGD